MTRSGTPEAYAVVSCGSFRAVLEPGQTLTFGRGHGHVLRIGHAPEDLRVPRFAGKLECRDDGVLVHNMSDKRTLAVQTFPGPGYEVLPLMIAGTHPYPQVKIVIAGRAADYAIMVDTRQLERVVRSTPVSQGAGEESTVGFARIDTMSRRHRLLLTALCLPGLTRTGVRAQPPTYAEMEQILRSYGHKMRAKTIRNGLLDLRGWLSYEHGVEGLIGNESGPQTDNFLVLLEQWAIRSGNVTDADLDLLEDEGRERPPDGAVGPLGGGCPE